jgi:hypothetical protein
MVSLKGDAIPRKSKTAQHHERSHMDQQSLLPTWDTVTLAVAMALHVYFSQLYRLHNTYPATFPFSSP